MPSTKLGDHHLIAKGGRMNEAYIYIESIVGLELRGRRDGESTVRSLVETVE